MEGQMFGDSKININGGKIVLKASSPGLKSSQVIIETMK